MIATFLPFPHILFGASPTHTENSSQVHTSLILSSLIESLSLTHSSALSTLSTTCFSLSPSHEPFLFFHILSSTSPTLSHSYSASSSYVLAASPISFLFSISSYFLLYFSVSPPPHGSLLRHGIGLLATFSPHKSFPLLCRLLANHLSPYSSSLVYIFVISLLPNRYMWQLASLTRVKWRGIDLRNN